MATHFIEFETREGLSALIRADDLSSWLETSDKGANRQPRKVFFLTLRNNNRIEVIGETRESILAKLSACQGIQPVILERDLAPEPEEDAA